ncbi:hypothetical protein FGW37_23030 [Streptomyces rectiverticillatus]|uniref:hypothetical protein n=1 Tax=Streptomyces rectiverticillatus TaxID=173860 RepID=UPI0015C2F58E|nr:hypothetical protein [Streptomyces rectiverticillatus]QLE74075.1 hypothetical protein FGW37_23030 [Streptomyces rectiverticillatus]
MKAIRKSVVAATGVALALSLAACGGGSGGKDEPAGSGSGKSDSGADKALKAAEPAGTLKAAAAKGARENTYRTKGKRKDTDGEYVTEGAFQAKPHASVMKDVGPKTAETPDGLNHVITVNDKMYFNGEKVPGKKWWTFSVEGADKSKDPSSELFVRMTSALATSKNVKNTGVETVGGRRAARFQGTVVVSELAAYKGDAITDKDRSFVVNGYKNDGVQQVDLVVWVDGDGVVAKTEESGKGSKGEFRRTDEYFDWGADLGIKPPPAAETATEKEVLETEMKKQQK